MMEAGDELLMVPLRSGETHVETEDEQAYPSISGVSAMTPASHVPLLSDHDIMPVHQAAFSGERDDESSAADDSGSVDGDRPTGGVSTSVEMFLVDTTTTVAGGTDGDVTLTLPVTCSRASLTSAGLDVCRICHCSETEPVSELMSPCACAGSLKYVHQSCLQQWIKSANTKACELCKFEFEMSTKVKPFRQWQRLPMSSLERRKVICSVVFHAVALTCALWCMYVLAVRTTKELRADRLGWAFWTKLIIVAIGFIGGVVFMYIQCKMYSGLCRRWRAYNRVIYIQNAPEKKAIPPDVTVQVKTSKKM